MGMNRVTNTSLNNQSISYLQSNLGILNSLQEKISSGKNINRPSDDPVGLTRILNLTNTLRTDDRYKTNIENALSEVNTADTVMSNAISLIQRVQELTTQAANTSNSQDGRTAIALEVDQIIDQMVQLGNTDIGGVYIFGGFETGSPPFARTASATGAAQTPPIQDIVTFTGSPPTGSWQRQAEISKGVTLNMNINGETLLGSSTGLAAAPIPGPPGVGGAGIFQTLTTLLADLHYPDPAAPDTQIDEIRLRLDELTVDLNNVLGQQAINGSVTNRLDLTIERIEERQAILTQQYSSIQDIDMAETIANLNNQENIFQASLGVTARVLQTSLLNYLR